MENNLVSICMITYNHEKFIAQAIEGVMMQKTNFDFELVIGEDCSTDKTREICINYKNKFPDKINLLLNEKNLGMQQNFINTSKACKGKYIALCEGDDYWTDPFKLQKQFNFLENNQEYVMCHHRVKIIDDNGDFIRDSIEHQKTKQDLIDFSHNNLAYTNTVFFRNIINDELFTFIENSYIGDYPLYLFLLQYGNAYFFNEIMSCYRYHPQGIWSTTQTEEKFYILDSFYKFILQHFKENKLFVDNFIKQYYENIFNIFNHYIENKEYQKIENLINEYDNIDLLKKLNISLLEQFKQLDINYSKLLSSKKMRFANLVFYPIKLIKRLFYNDKKR